METYWVYDSILNLLWGWYSLSVVSVAIYFMGLFSREFICGTVYLRVTLQPSPLSIWILGLAPFFHSTTTLTSFGICFHDIRFFQHYLMPWHFLHPDSTQLGLGCFRSSKCGGVTGIYYQSRMVIPLYVYSR